MDVLGKLFGSEARVRLLRLFFLNAELCFEAKDIAKKTKTSSPMVRRELQLLVSIGVVRRQAMYRSGGEKRASRKKVDGWCLDRSFHYADELKNLLVSTDLVKKGDIMDRFRRAGTVKLLVISGIFIKNDSSRLDILVVGDRLKRSIIENTLRSLEAEAGKELRYAILETPEFRYRLSMYDKFVRDILDYPHEVIINRLGVENL